MLTTDEHSIDIDRAIENEHYVVHPSPRGEQEFDITIYYEEYSPTVIYFYNIVINGKTKEIMFDFEIISSPILGLSKENDPNIRRLASLVLQDFIFKSAQQGNVTFIDMPQ